MENENKKLELNDNELEKAVGGYAIAGEDTCSKGLKWPSLAVCPNKGCGEYRAKHPMANYTPYCDYFCMAVR